MTSLPFADRSDAAQQLAKALARLRGTRPVILAIPRGAVPMGKELANALGGELDLALVHKLGAPGYPELAVGAVDEQGTIYVADYAGETGADDAYIRREAARQLAEIRARRQRYGGGRAPIPLAGRVVIVVDDGLATGNTMSAALKAARAQQPARLICAVPVAARESARRIAPLADEVVCLATPDPFRSVGGFYRRFEQVEDDQVMALLADRDTDSNEGELQHRSVRISAGHAQLEGDLVTPAASKGLVLFAHGSGSSRLSPRNRFVASVLNGAGFTTLLLDLLTPIEDSDRAARFDIALLADRLDAALDWALAEPALASLPIGLFGASTGAAAALILAASRPDEIGAVVSRGGRPDLAGSKALAQVRAPTLLIVGGNDYEVLELNRTAQSNMPGSGEIAVVPHATHLFEEPGTLEQAAELASGWFQRWLPA